MLRLSALFLGLLGLVGLYFHSTLPVTGRIRPGFFVFYTNLSNLLLAVYQLTLGVSGHDPQCGVFRWLSSAGVALSMTLCIFVTHHRRKRAARRCRTSDSAASATCVSTTPCRG